MRHEAERGKVAHRHRRATEVQVLETGACHQESQIRYVIAARRHSAVGVGRMNLVQGQGCLFAWLETPLAETTDSWHSAKTNFGSQV